MKKILLVLTLFTLLILSMSTALASGDSTSNTCYGAAGNTSSSCHLPYTCENPIIVDFEGYRAGTVVTNQIPGITVLTRNNANSHPSKSIIFNSSLPTGGDVDLGTPNQAYGGPGIGFGANAGAGNTQALKNILIIAENDVDANSDGRVDNPDDEANGGNITFIFNEPFIFNRIVLVDAEEAGGSVRLYAANGAQTLNVPIPASTDNSVQSISSNLTNYTATKMVVKLKGSGAIGHFSYCLIQQPECGDGHIDSGEQCDDGNQNNTDSCRNDCTFPVCGDDIIDSGEECESDGQCTATECDQLDGCVGPNYYNYTDRINECTDQCSCTDKTCSTPHVVYNDPRCGPYCGNSILENGEECDDGNQANGDGCSNSCTFELNDTCTPRTIGYWQQPCLGNYQHETPATLSAYLSVVHAQTNFFDTVSSFSQLCMVLQPTTPATMQQRARQQLMASWLNVASGKIFLNTVVDLTPLSNSTAVGQALFEAEGIYTSNPERTKDIADTLNNAAHTGGIILECKPAVCGNGAVENGEQCDDGNQNNTDSCRNDCTFPVCGDGIVDAGEACEYDHQCQPTECDDRDGCYGNDYYNYTDVANTCNSQCGCTDNTCSAPAISYNDERCTQCQDNDDCNALDLDFCLDTIIMHQEGVCENYVCVAQNTTVEDCSDRNSLECSGSYIVDTTYTCDDAQCVVNDTTEQNCDNGLYCDGSETCTNAACITGTPITCDDNVSCTQDSCNEETDSCTNNPNTAACDNGLYCDGSETCDAILGCVPGIVVDCSGSDLDGINTCLNNPDGINVTFDYYAGFNSTCNEATDSCTTSTMNVTSVCSVDMCGAQCDATHECVPTECDDRDGCYGNDYYDYNDVANTCNAECGCSDNECLAPTISFNDARCGPTCGNGAVDSGEECDDGNHNSGDGCDSECRREECGNSRIDADEQCDDGENNANDEECNTECKLTYCGDGTVQEPNGNRTGGTNGYEQCDDGNSNDNDGCLNTCLLNICGDGILNSDDEQCDDGNLENGDGCDNACTPEEPISCQEAVDVMLVMDRSGSMSVPDPQRLNDAKDAAVIFLNAMNWSKDTAGLASFNNSATLDKPLSDQLISVVQKVRALRARGATNIGDGLKVGRQELLSNGGENKVMILLSDGAPNVYPGGYCFVNPTSPTACTEYAVDEAQTAKDNGIEVFTIGLGVNSFTQDLLKEMASSQDHYFFAPNSSDLASIYAQVALTMCN